MSWCAAAFSAVDCFRWATSSNDEEFKLGLSYGLAFSDMLISTCSKVVRKSIARVLTVVNQNKKDAVRELYKDKKFLPLDIRSVSC